MELTDLCKELNNWFCRERYFGKFKIVNGVLAGNFSLQDGQYFRICDSVFNDGVYQYPASGLVDEVFEGAVWAMAVPPTVIALQTEIEEWLANDDVKKALRSPYTSESFGGYTYTKASRNTSQNGGMAGYTWQEHFADQLNRWRKI
jgi:hypothetical protein